MTLDPAVVTSPATSNNAFTETMRPSSGPSIAPPLRRASDARASFMAESAKTAVKTLEPSSSGERIRSSAISKRLAAATREDSLMGADALFTN